MAIASMPSSRKSSSAETSFDDGDFLRFSAGDALGYRGGDTNLYRYVSNSPTNATDPTGLAEQPATPAMSKAAQELYDLLRKSALFRDYLEKVAKGSTKVERGGFILIRIHGNGPMYKIV
jgi:uncharacterized protein RhaS with RHS repeats